ncbi:hypothetical protein RFI_14902, partial [Reticulomyxa filosa]
MVQPEALKSKILSLELLRLVFANAGHAFRSSGRFLDAVRENFVPVVAENAVSTVEGIFQLAVSMFSMLVEQFRKYLKNEIGLLLDQVFLQIAESPHASYKQKLMALSVCSKICRDSQMLVGIFLNFDCGDKQLNIFQRIVNLLENFCCVKLSEQQWLHQPENIRLRRSAIEIMVAIIRSMLEWVIKAKKKVKLFVADVTG